jgi:hypothetical protein
VIRFENGKQQIKEGFFVWQSGFLAAGTDFESPQLLRSSANPANIPVLRRQLRVIDIDKVSAPVSPRVVAKILVTQKINATPGTLRRNACPSALIFISVF